MAHAMTRESRIQLRWVGLLALAVAAAAALLLAAATTSTAQEPEGASATVVDQQGTTLGTVSFFDAQTADLGAGTLVYAELDGLPGGGFHGFHIHGIGVCDPADGFVSAGGHFNPSGDPHGEHAGDMPVLYATEAGIAVSVFVTDRFTVDDLLDSEDGTAVIVHAAPDNFANIPDRYVSGGDDLPDGYVSGPDNPTLATGDAGARIGCGVVEDTAGDFPEPPPFRRTVEAPLQGLDGSVLFGEVDDENVVVIAEVEGLPGDGFHGFHVHGVGICDEDDGFVSAGGHFNPAGDPHGEHAGDMPVLYAGAEGTAFGAFVTDRFSISDLMGTDTGTAVIVHAAPDNFANIPDRYVSTGDDLPDGYVSGPDSPTLATGDAGARLGCGVVTMFVEVTRFFGADRVETAIAVSQELYPEEGSASTVLLARSDDFADALAGTPLAVALDGPTLLTPTGELDARTHGEINRVLGDAGTVHVLGGTAAISDAVATRLADDGYAVERVFGDDRYETAVAVADALGNPDTVLVARGTDFADAVAAGAAAAAVDAAVLLTTDDAPQPATDAYLDEHAPSTLVAVGGPAARAYPDAEEQSGAHRWETARLIAERFFDEPPAIGLARSDAFPDALTGGVLAGNLGGPMLLTQPTQLHADTAAYLCAQAGTAARVDVFGGTAAIDATVLQTVADRVSGEGCPTG